MTPSSFWTDARKAVVAAANDLSLEPTRESFNRLCIAVYGVPWDQLPQELFEPYPVAPLDYDAIDRISEASVSKPSDSCGAEFVYGNHCDEKKMHELLANSVISDLIELNAEREIAAYKWATDSLETWRSANRRRPGL